MIDVTEIDLDKLTTLELWELHERVAARLGPWDREEDLYDSCPGQMSSFNSYAARARMKALL